MATLSGRAETPFRAESPPLSSSPPSSLTSGWSSNIRFDASIKGKHHQHHLKSGGPTTRLHRTRSLDTVTSFSSSQTSPLRNSFSDQTSRVPRYRPYPKKQGMAPLELRFAQKTLGRVPRTSFTSIDPQMVGLFPSNACKKHFDNILLGEGHLLSRHELSLRQ